jgi:hypothetical protein
MQSPDAVGLRSQMLDHAMAGRMCTCLTKQAVRKRCGDTVTRAKSTNTLPKSFDQVWPTSTVPEIAAVVGSPVQGKSAHPSARVTSTTMALTRELEAHLLGLKHIY